LKTKHIIEDQILDIIDQHGQLGRKKIETCLIESGIAVNKSTILRKIKRMLEKQHIQKTGKGKGTEYFRNDIEQYLSKPPHERPVVSYNFDLLTNYFANHEQYFSTEEINRLSANSSFYFTDASTYLKNLYLTLVIDLSYASSKLEGNTYSWLDTQMLIEYGEEAQGKTIEETIMILNHKNAVNYIFENIDTIDISPKTVYDIHSLLSMDLIHRSYVGTIRKGIVGIAGSSYHPLDHQFQLTEELKHMLLVANKINNPFEQSLFLLVHLSYLQPFWDVNKRTSRIIANIPLLKNTLFPLSFMTIHKKRYIQGLLIFYELNRIDLLKQEYMASYLKSIDRYKSRANVIKKTDRAVLMFRKSINNGVVTFIRDCQHVSIEEIVDNILKSQTFSQNDNIFLQDNHIDPRKYLIYEITDAIKSVNENNIVAYGISPEDYKKFKACIDATLYHKNHN